MKKLNHPHVVRLLEVIDDPMQDKIYMGACSVPVCFPSLSFAFVLFLLRARHCDMHAVLPRATRLS